MIVELITVLWIAVVVGTAHFILTIVWPDLFSDNLDSADTEPLLTDSPVPSPLYKGKA